MRENEDAAQALGVDLVARKLATMLSAAMAATGGVFYVQNFLFVDSHIAFGPGMSIEALLAPIIGGMGTVFGPLFGAVVLHALGEIAKQITGNAPGLNLVLYGVRADRGRAFPAERPCRRARRAGAAPASIAERRHG